MDGGGDKGYPCQILNHSLLDNEARNSSVASRGLSVLVIVSQGNKAFQRGPTGNPTVSIRKTIKQSTTEDGAGSPNDAKAGEGEERV